MRKGTDSFAFGRRMTLLILNAAIRLCNKKFRKESGQGDRILPPLAIRPVMDVISFNITSITGRGGEAVSFYRYPVHDGIPAGTFIAQNYTE